MKQKHHYVYIVAGGVKPSDYICNYRLITAPLLSKDSQAVRVVADTIQLAKVKGQDYYITTDTRTIAELGYDCMVRINWRWTIREDIQPKTIDDMFLPYDVLTNKGYTFAIGSKTHPLQPSYLDSNAVILHEKQVSEPIQKGLEERAVKYNGGITTAERELRKNMTLWKVLTNECQN